MTDHPAWTNPTGPPATVLVVDALANNGAVHIAIDLADRWAPHGATLAVVEHLPAVSAMVPSTAPRLPTSLRDPVGCVPGYRGLSLD